MHLQLPQIRQREDQDGEIGDDIQRRCTIVTADFGVDAFSARNGFVPPVCNWSAKEGDQEDVDDEPDDGENADYDGDVAEGAHGEDSVVEY